jgi:hypothetical protein
VDELHSAGVSRNSFWKHRGRSLLMSSAGSAISARLSDGEAPAGAGHLLMPGLAHGTGPIATAAAALQMDDLGLTRYGYTHASVSARLRPLLHDEDAAALIQRADGAILSETWSPRDEDEFGRRVDRITANELIEALEWPGQPLALLSLGKGGPLYGEGRYASEVQLRPRSNTVPSAYVTDREGR